MENNAFPAEPALPGLLARAGLVNLLVGVGALVTGSAVLGGIWAAFAAGYLLGAFNQYMSIRAARRGVSSGISGGPARAMAIVATQYFFRYALTISLFAMLALKARQSPWALAAGFVTAFFVSTAAAVLIARGEPHNPTV
jgi:hypothetical protein